MMNPIMPTQLQLPFGVQIRPRLRLSEVEDLIKKHRIVVPCPSRQTLIRMCEEGIFDTPTRTPGLSGWMVFEDSFWAWAGFDSSTVMQRAA